MTNPALELLQAEARRDTTAIGALLDENVVFEMPFAEPPATIHGREALLEVLDQFLHTFYSEFTFHDIEVTPAAEPGLYFAEYRGIGQVAARPHEYRQQYVAVIKVQDGKVTLWREYFNPIALREALA